jgi:hypothetical protein
LKDLGVVLSGNAVDIVLSLKAKQFGGDDLSVREFIVQFAERMARFNAADVVIEGDSDPELAQSLIDHMIRLGLAEVVDPEELKGNGKEDK